MHWKHVKLAMGERVASRRRAPNTPVLVPLLVHGLSEVAAAGLVAARANALESLVCTFGAKPAKQGH